MKEAVEMLLCGMFGGLAVGITVGYALGHREFLALAKALRANAVEPNSIENAPEERQQKETFLNA